MIEPAKSQQRATGRPAPSQGALSLRSEALVFMYSGQGSQYYQMGRDLYQRSPSFRRHLDELDALAYDATGLLVRDFIFDSIRKPFETFTDSVMSGVAIYLVERALTKTVLEHQVRPDLIVSSSFGVLAAAATAGCFSDEDAFLYVARHERVFAESCEPGCMIAILRNPDFFLRSAALFDRSELSAVNFDQGFAISLPQRNIEEVTGFLKSSGVSFQALPTVRAYHSKWIDAARGALHELYAGLGQRRPSIPIVGMGRQGRLEAVGAESIWEEIRLPIMFERTMSDIEECGCHRYVDMGPSGTMATLAKYVIPRNSKSTIFSILGPYGGSAERLDSIVGSERHR